MRVALAQMDVKAGFIGRFKPLHNGAAFALDALCETHDSVIIGIGSTNKYDKRNPFSPKETEEMIRIYLEHTNYSIVHIPDYGTCPGNENGQLWKEHLIREFGNLETFYTGNPYVASLLESTYKIQHPVTIIPLEKQIRMRATTVRYALATDDDWTAFVPQEIAHYMQENKLDKRFKKEFGLETIAEHAGTEYWSDDDLAQEKAQVMG